MASQFRLCLYLVIVFAATAFFWNKKESAKISSELKPPYTVVLYASGSHENGKNVTLTAEDCGKNFTELVCNRFRATGSDEEDAAEADACSGVKVFTETGTLVESCKALKKEGQKLFVVEAGKLFVFPTVEIGHKVTLDHVTSGLGTVTLETLSHSPRVFKITNFFTEKEADDLIAHTLTITAEDYRLKRSTTGQDEHKHEDMSRTSDTAFDPFSSTAMTLKKRSFELLGIRPYNNDWADGLQVLRYNVTRGYNTHMDYIDSYSGRMGHNYKSHDGGTNRFATVFLYLSKSLLDIVIVVRV
jgi:prolyl 4-hydroxylase